MLTPLTVVDLSDSLLNELYKVLKPKNGYWDVIGTKINNIDEIKDFAVDARIWLEKQYKKTIKNQPSLTVVVDFDVENEPKLIAVDSDRIIDAKLDPDGQYQYIIFQHSTTIENGQQVVRVAFYDNERYDVYKEVGNSYILEEELSNEHNIGYCPAHSISWEALTSTGNYRRKGPLTSVISKLQEWQFFDLYKFISDHYGSMPITERIVDGCTNLKCENGWEKVMVESNEPDVKSQEARVKCHVCSSKKAIGPLTDIKHI
ncbi:unnamed protein product, partial [marine sediment metagenome]